jgi:sulfhydrogenase subunit beta (sulfur reductase)
MKEAGFVPKEALKTYLGSLAKRFALYAPCKEGEVVVFQRFQPDREVCLDRPANTAPKGVIFPQSETLFAFNLKNDPDNPKRTDVELDDSIPATDAVIIAGRPCDAKGFLTLDPVYMDVDPYYRARREKTTIITLACSNPYPGCFCTSVDGGPAEKSGSDALMTEVEGGYYIEAVTDKGKAVLDDPAVQDGASRKVEAESTQKAAYGKVKKTFQGGRGVKISKDRFLSDEFWEEVTAKCLSCGACTYICPTCYCFNITDEQSISKGERIRSWDSCMFPHFTLETSGHNPRSKKAQRFKQRVGHKFVYYPEKYAELACSGCGRCIRYCPISMEISKVVAMLSDGKDEAAKTGVEGA